MRISIRGVCGSHCLQGIKIGTEAQIGAGIVIINDVRDNSLVVGIQGESQKQSVDLVSNFNTYSFRNCTLAGVCYNETLSFVLN